MTKLEVLKKHRTAIEQEAVKLYRTVLESDGDLQFSLYIWEDGEIESLQDVSGGNDTLRPRDSEPRQLFFVTKVSAPAFSWVDMLVDPVSEDEVEQEQQNSEAIDFAVDAFKDEFSDRLDSIIKEVEMFG